MEVIDIAVVSRWIAAYAAEAVAEERRRCKAWAEWVEDQNDGENDWEFLLYTELPKAISGIESGEWPEGVDRG